MGYYDRLQIRKEVDMNTPNKKTFPLTEGHSGDLFSMAGWIMLNNFIQQEMIKPENKEWFDNSTWGEVLDYGLHHKHHVHLADYPSEVE